MEPSIGCSIACIWGPTFPGWPNWKLSRTLRRVWIQHYHGREQGTAWRADDEQTYTTLQKARKRQETSECADIVRKRAGIEGTVAQAVRTCEMRQARYIGGKKLRLRACEWLMRGKLASTPISRAASLVATAEYAAAA